jgi:flagellar hook-associated protein 1 FlgK
MVMNIARGAFFAYQKALDVTAHNIANVNTPGYSRQSLVLQSADITTVNRLKLGYGVVADSVQQAVDEYTNRSLFERTSTLMGYETKKTVLDSVEALFNEATGNGLNRVLTDFWNSWQSLANNPGGIPERTDLLEKTQTLAEKFQTARNNLAKAQADMNINLTGAIAEINKICEQIADTNERIVAAEASGTRANDLRDKRNNLVQNLSEFLDITYLENSSGAYTVMTQTGIPLVDGKYFWRLSQQGNEIYWKDIQTDISRRLTGGKVGAWLDMRDNLLPQMMANLDELAGKLIHEVNSLHYIDGYTLDGLSHEFLFEHLNTIGEVKYGSWEGTAEATSGGDYTGRLEKEYTFTVPAGTIGTGDLTVNWTEATTGRSGTITIPDGYTAGTAIQVDGVNAAVESSTWAGTSHATALGNYTGSNDRYTFTIQSVNGTGSGTGTVGTDEIVIYWENRDKTARGTLSLEGPAYAPGTALSVEKGLQLSFSSGTLKVGDQFTVETEQGIEVSFSSGTLISGDTFTISTADYSGAARNIALSTDLKGNPRNIAASSSSIASETANNQIALAIAALQDTPFTIQKWTYEDRGDTRTTQGHTQTLGEYYNIFVGDIGVMAKEAANSQNFHQTMVNQLQELRDSRCGVSLDEEVINMMRFQYAYQAAAKLITTADDLFQTLIALR